MATVFPKFAPYPQNLGESAVAASPFLNIKASDLISRTSCLIWLFFYRTLIIFFLFCWIVESIRLTAVLTGRQV